MAAGRHNDSSQMRDSLRYNESPEKKTKSDAENGSKDFRGEASGSSSSGPRDVRGSQARADEAVQWEKSSLTCQLKDMRRLPECRSRLGPLSHSGTHTVLIDADVFNREGRTSPQQGRDFWHKNFVKLPSSNSNFMMTKRIGMTKQTLRWDVISKRLRDLASKKTVTVDDVKNAIVKYNQKYKDQWSFDALSTFLQCVPSFENYYPTLLPKIAALALTLPEQVKKAIPLLQSGQTAAITLSQLQISCLLANAFFCTFPHRNDSSPSAEYHNYPSINFSSLFGNWSKRKGEKLRAIMHYFNVVTDEKTKPQGLVTFERRCLQNSDIPSWRSCNETLGKLYVSSVGSIETQGAGMLQVDFASSWIGGGVLDKGLVQEEIMFLMNPEMILSRLFTERLGENECLIIRGSQQFSRYSGFSDTFEWAGPHEEHLQKDEWTRLQRHVLAIDALSYKHRADQYRMNNVTRELNKAYCGFKANGDQTDIATGKWGCGAFNGDSQLKAVIQLMAAAKAKRGLAFFTFGDENLQLGLESIFRLLVTEQVKLGKLFELLEDFCSMPDRSRPLLFDFISSNIPIGRPQSLL